MVSHHWCAGQSLSASHGITSPSQSTTSEVCDGPPSRQTGMQGTPSTFSLQQTASEAGMWPLVHGGAEAHGSCRTQRGTQTIPKQNRHMAHFKA